MNEDMKEHIDKTSASFERLNDTLIRIGKRLERLATKDDLKDVGLKVARLEGSNEAITTGILKAYDSADITTKGDLRELQLQVNAKIDNFEARITIKLGSMLIAAIGVLSVIIKFF